MKLLSIFTLAVLGFGQLSMAGITFQLNTSTPTVAAGTQAVFTLNLVSDVPGGELITGAAANVNAGPGDGTAGIFVTPSAHTGILGIGSLVDFTTSPGQLYADNTLPMSGTLTVLDGGGVTWINMFLDTTGISSGIYTLSLDSLAVTTNIGPTFTSPFSGSTVNFEITAVPEPTSLLAGTTLGFFGVMYRRRRRSD